jgi:hypothetical protein
MWNWLDMTLALVGLVTCIVDIIGQLMNANDGSGGYFDSLKALKILRALRCIRIINTCQRAFKSMYAKIAKTDEEVADMVSRVELLICFIKGHSLAQHDMFVFLGKPPDCHPEAALCVLQSERQVFVALVLLKNEIEKLSQLKALGKVEGLLEERRTCLDAIEVIHSRFKPYIEGGQEREILSNSEATALLHNLDHSAEAYEARIAHIRKGKQLEKRITGFDIIDYKKKTVASAMKVLTAVGKFKKALKNQQSLHQLDADSAGLKGMKAGAKGGKNKAPTVRLNTNALKGLS